MTPAQIRGRLIQAKFYLQDHGWQRGDYGGVNGAPACIKGAVLRMTADGEFDDTQDVLDILRRWTGKWVTCWNDHPRRTFEDILFLFDRAILSLDPK